MPHEPFNVMEIEVKTSLSDEEKQRITALWNAEYPAPIKYESVAGFEIFLRKNADHTHYLIRDDAGRPAAWLTVFTRDGGRWFSIIVDSAAQGRGFGRALLDAARRREPQLFGWVVPDDRFRKTNGEIYRSPLEFYRKIGFEVVAGVEFDGDGFQAVKICWKRDRLKKESGKLD